MKQTMVRSLIVAGLLLAIVGCAETGNDAEPTAAATDAEVVATVGGHPITMDDVDSKAKENDVGPYSALYDARKQALEMLVSERILDTEAKERGITVEQLVEQEVNQKIESPSAEQIEQFYAANKAAMRGNPLEAMSAQIQNRLAGQSRQNAMGTLLSSLKSKNNVTMSLDPPRVPVTVAANDPVKGPAGAPVQIVEFSDFQ